MPIWILRGACLKLPACIAKVYCRRVCLFATSERSNTFSLGHVRSGSTMEVFLVENFKVSLNVGSKQNFVAFEVFSKLCYDTKFGIFQ